MRWLVNILCWVLAAVLWFSDVLDWLSVAHPAMLYAAMGIMIVFMLGKAYQRELEKEKRRGSDPP